MEKSMGQPGRFRNGIDFLQIFRLRQEWAIWSMKLVSIEKQPPKQPISISPGAQFLLAIPAG
jgi:hypothetical protein